MKSGYFYISCLSFVAGVLLATFFALSMHSVIVLGLTSFCVFLFTQFISSDRVRILSFTTLAFFSLSLGMLRYQQAATFVPIQNIESSIGQKIRVETVVLEEPQASANNLRFAIAPEKVSGTSVVTKIKILVTVDLHADISYGDRVLLEGKINLPQNFTTDGGSKFDYVSYLAKDDIRYLMKNPEIKIISHGNGSKIISMLLFIKHAFVSSINRALPAPENLFANGLLVGIRSSLPQSLTDAFVRTGTIHMVALSGYNISIVVGSIMSMLEFLPIAVASGVGILSIILFALLVGGGSTVIRASIMASLLVLSKYIGRIYDVVRALVLAGTIMIAINPRILVYDSSFQLSFLATLGMLYLSPKIEPHLGFIPKRLGLREIATGTLAAELSVFPLIVYKTGVLSLVSIPTNILVLPFVSWAMLFGFLTGAIGLVSHIVAIPFAFISYGLLHYMLTIVQWFATLPFAALTMRHVSIIFILGFYAALVWWVIEEGSKIKKPLI